MIKTVKYGALFILAVLLYGCYPKGAETVDDTNLVFTNHDDSFDFVSERTYYLVPNVTYIDSTATPDPQVDAVILSEIVSQFQKLNYTRLDTISDPSQVNIVVMASQIKETNTSVSWWPGWGGWYGGWWGGWGGWGGCCWGGVPVVSSFNTGTIYIDAFDPQTPPIIEGQLPPVVWTAGMNGVLNNNSIGLETRIRTVIEQAFTQSDYL